MTAPSELAALRLAALGVVAADAGTPAEAVRRLLALQGQDFPGSLWSVGLRVADSTADDIEAAFARGEIVRSWPMRGTLHVVAADDLRWMLGLTGLRMVRAAEGRRRQLGLEADDFARAEAVVRARLEGGRQATRAELFAELAAGGVAPDGQRGVHTLGQLSQLGVLVQSGRDAWRLLAEWVPSPRRLEGDEALREFAMRYMLGHGPATARDFAWWSGLTLTDARTGLAAAGDALERIDVDSETYFLRPGLEPAPRGVHLLPGFDEFVLGYTDRSPQLPPQHWLTIVPGGNGIFLSTIVVDGQIVGTWKRVKATAKPVTIAFSPFATLSTATMAAAHAAVERYAAFLGTDVEVAG